MEQLISSPKVLGSVIKRQRRAKKLSQSTVGAAFKLNQTTVSSIEQGVSGTRLETLFRMLAALELEMVIRSKKTTSELSGDNW